MASMGLQSNANDVVQAHPPFDGRLSSSPNPVQFVSIDHPDHALLKPAYDQLLRPAFLNPDDLDEFDDLRRYFLWNARRNTARYFTQVAVAGRDLVGVTVYSFFVMDGLTFMKAEYTAVGRPWRRLGIAARLCRAREEHAHTLSQELGRHLDFSLIYLVDPQLISPDARRHYDPAPEQLNRIWRQMGHLKLDFPFLQLPLKDHRPCASHLRLWIKPWSAQFLGRTELAAEEVEVILRAANYYRSSRGRLSEYPEFRQMITVLRSMRVVQLQTDPL